MSRELLCLAKLKEELHRAYERIVELGQTPIVKILSTVISTGSLKHARIYSFLARYVSQGVEAGDLNCSSVPGVGEALEKVRRIREELLKSPPSSEPGLLRVVRELVSVLDRAMGVVDPDRLCRSLGSDDYRRLCVLVMDSVASDDAMHRELTRVMEWFLREEAR